MSPGPVLLRKFVRSSKHDKLVQEVELTHANPTHAYIKHRDRRESTVSLSDLAPCPRDHSADHSVKQIGSVSDDIVRETADVSEPNVAPSMKRPAGKWKEYLPKSPRTLTQMMFLN